MTRTGTDALVARLGELLAKATKGRWRVGRQDGAPRDHLVDMGEPPKAPYFRMHKGIPASPVMRGDPAFGIVESDDAEADEIAANAALIVEAKNALPTLLAERESLLADLAAAKGVIEPFARAASSFDFAVGPDGIDDGLTVLAKTVVRPEYDATLCTSHFRAAAAFMAKGADDGTG